MKKIQKSISIAREEYIAPALAEISISTENVMVVSGTHEGYEDGGDLNVFGDFDMTIDIESIGTLF